MPSPKRFALWGLAAVLASSLGLQAQEAASPFSFDWKMRVGYAPSAKDNLRQGSLGFGFNFGYKLGDGKLGAELGYTYKTGDNYFTMPDTSKIAAGREAIDPTKTVVDKRNEFEGLTLRLSYQQDINTTWAWQAGLQIGGRFHQQAIIDTRSQNYSSSVAANVSAGSWRDLYNTTRAEYNLIPSPFAGVVWNVDKDSSVEFNLLLLSYTALNYHHYVGASSTPYYGGVHQEKGDNVNWVGPICTDIQGFPADSLDKSTHIMPHFEITYTLHF